MAISGRQLRFRRWLSCDLVGYCEIATGAKRPRNDKSGAIAILTLPRTSLRCVAGPGCPCVLHVLRGLFPREQQRGEDGEDAARELGRDNIRVNAVAPGVTRTDMVANLPEEMVKRVCAPIPLQRMGEPQEVANAFLFLASDLASYVTGEILSVDGAAQT